MAVGIESAGSSAKSEQGRPGLNRYQSSEPCIYCGEIILTKTGIISIRGKSCHPECIRCSKCGNEVDLEDSMVVVVEDEIVITCDDCRTNRCEVCNELCDGSRYTNNGITYHFECLKCHSCEKMFTKEMQILHKAGLPVIDGSDHPLKVSDMYQMTGTGIKLRKNVTLALTDNRMRFQLSDLTGQNFHVDCSLPTKKQSPNPYIDVAYLKEEYTQLSELGLFPKSFVIKHNELRARHGAPPLGWSERLTARARRWAIHLTVLNKDYPATNLTIHTQRGLGYGQSNSCIVGKTRRGLDQLAAQCCEDWYKTGQRYTYDETIQAECSTFTQMIWKDSRAVGACITWFGDVGFIVANYWPPGNRTDAHIENVRPEGGERASVVDTVLNGSHLEQEKSPKPVSDSLIKEIGGQVKKKKKDASPEPTIRKRISSGDNTKLSEITKPKVSEKPQMGAPPVSEKPVLVKKVRQAPGAKLPETEKLTLNAQKSSEKVAVSGAKGMGLDEELELLKHTDQSKAVRKTSVEEPIKPRHSVNSVVSVEADSVEQKFCGANQACGRKLSEAILNEENLMNERKTSRDETIPEEENDDTNDEELEFEEEDLTDAFLKKWDKKKKMNLKVVPYLGLENAKELRVLKAKRKKLIGGVE